jgi:hypothetical protein
MNEQQQREFNALKESVVALTASVTTLNESNAKLRESADRSNALRTVTRKLAATKLPALAQKRVETFFESVQLPADVTALETQVDAKIKEEQDYLRECGAVGVRGLGESAPVPSTTQPKPEELESQFNESIASLAGVPLKGDK